MTADERKALDATILCVQCRQLGATWITLPTRIAVGDVVANGNPPTNTVRLHPECKAAFLVDEERQIQETREALQSSTPFHGWPRV